MDSHRDDNDLVAALHSLRPTPRGEFAAELDARAAAGFPRDAQAPASVLSRIAERFRATPPVRILAPAGAVALTAIVVATAVVATTEDQPTRSMVAAPEQAKGERFSGAASSGSAAAGSNSAAAADAAVGTGRAGDMLLNQNGGYATGAGQRAVERSAHVVLGTDPDRVRADAAKVFDAVHAVDGIVLRSSIRDGAAGQAGAEFELLIPSGKLGDAMADFSAIAEVRSRREATQDITAPTVGTRERLEDSEARIDSLLAQLAEATTETERAAVEAELRTERRQAAALRSHLAALSRRANLSRVSLRIETGAATTSSDDGGAWGVGDGLDDAGRILEVAAGVTIVGLAVIGPLALIGLLAWLAYRAWVHAARRRALGQAG